MKRMEIPGTFASMNAFIDANRRRNGSWSAGNAMKQRDQKTIEAYIRKQLKAPLREPVFISFVYRCKDKKRDPDNVAGYFHKIFLDALVHSGRLRNDGFANVIGLQDLFTVDRGNPRIEVEIWEDMELTWE